MADLLPEAILAAQPDLPVWSAMVTSVTPLEVDRGSGAQGVISLIPSHRHAVGDWVTVINMILNLITEYLFDRYVVYKNSMDTNDLAQKENVSVE